jgi:DNA polymerase (family 10)
MHSSKRHNSSKRHYSPQSYIDAKGRTRFHENDELAEQLKRLAQFLVVGGYPAQHAARYPKLAHTISRHSEPLRQIYEAGQLQKFAGIGETVAQIIAEFLETGTCTKWQEWKQHTPESVLDLTAIPNLGPQTVRVLYTEHGIQDLPGLRAALEAGKLTGIPGVGPKTLKSIRGYLEDDHVENSVC